MTGQKVLQVVILRDGLLVGTEVFVPGRYLIGSSSEADLRLLDGSVEGEHAALYFKNDKVVVQDQGAPSGLLVNGHRIRTCEVRPVDELSVGPFVLKVRLLAPKVEAAAPPDEVTSLLEAADVPTVARPSPAAPPAHTQTALSARRLAAAAAQPAAPPEKKTVLHLRAATPPPFDSQDTAQLEAPHRPPVQLRSVSDLVLAPGDPQDALRTTPGHELGQAAPQPPAPGEGDAVGRRPRLFLELYWHGQRQEARSFGGLSPKRPVQASAGDDAPMPLYGFRLPAQGFALADRVGSGFRLFVPEGARVERREGSAFRPVPLDQLQQENGRHYLSLADGSAARLCQGPMSLLAYVQPPLKRPFVNPLAGIPFLALFLFLLFGAGAGAFLWRIPPEAPRADFQQKHLPPVAIRLIAPPPKAKEQAKQKLAELAAKAEKKSQVAKQKSPPKPKRKSSPSAPSKALAALSKLSAAGPASKDILASMDKMGSGPGAKSAKRHELSGLLGKAPLANAGIGTFGLGGGGRGGVGTKGAEMLRGKGGAGIGALGAGNVGRGAVGGTVSRATSRSVRVKGSIDREAVAKVVNAHLQEVRACYERALLKDPGLAGKVVLEWTIASSGKVTSVKTKSSTLRNSAVEGCILSNLKRWTFPSPRGGMVIVSYPFLFNSVGY